MGGGVGGFSGGGGGTVGPPGGTVAPPAGVPGFCDGVGCDSDKLSGCGDDSCDGELWAVGFFLSFCLFISPVLSGSVYDLAIR